MSSSLVCQVRGLRPGAFVTNKPPKQYQTVNYGENFGCVVGQVLAPCNFAAHALNVVGLPILASQA